MRTTPFDRRAESRRRRKQSQEKGKNGDPQKAEAAFATADAIVEGEYITARSSRCLETHGMVVDYRGGDTGNDLRVDAGHIHDSRRRSERVGAAYQRRDDDGRAHGRRLRLEVWTRARRPARVPALETNQHAGKVDVHALRRVCDGG
jgi:hypothetical protein